MPGIALIALAVWVAVLTGCNTMHGIGKDISAAGEVIQKKSR